MRRSLMAADDRDEAGPPGRGPPLVLELVISESDPLTGLVGPAGSTDRLCFRGWIDLMSAVATLFAGHADSPPRADQVREALAPVTETSASSPSAGRPSRPRGPSQ